MDLVAIAIMMWRRWWLTIPLLALTLAATYQAYESRDILYETGVTVILEAGDDLGQAVSTNSGTPSGQVLVAILESDEVHAEVVGARNGVEYEVAAGLDVNGTIVQATAVADRPEDAVQVVQGLLDRMVVEVSRSEEEAGVIAEDRAVIQPLAVPLTATLIPADDDKEVAYEAEGASLVRVPATEPSMFPADSTTIRFLMELMQADAVQSRLQPDPGITVTVASDPNDQVPFFYIVAQAGSEDLASEALENALDESAVQLQALQSGLPLRAQTTSAPLTVPTGPNELEVKISRAVVALLALGLFVTVTLPVLVDGMLNARASRQSPKDPDDEGPAGDQADHVDEVASQLDVTSFGEESRAREPALATSAVRLAFSRVKAGRQNGKNHWARG